MPDKSEALREIFNKFADEVNVPLTSDGIRGFLDVYDASIGEYLECEKEATNPPTDPNKDWWDDDKFRKWALTSTKRVARKTYGKANGKPLKKDHVYDGAGEAFIEIGNDDYCGSLPHCKYITEKRHGPVCELFFTKFRQYDK